MMAPHCSMLSLFFIYSSALLVFAATLQNDAAQGIADSSTTRLQLQLRLLETKVYLLESSINEKFRELKKKDEKIREMEEIIQGKLNENSFLHSETAAAVKGRQALSDKEFIDNLQKKNAEELVNQVVEDIILQDKFKDKLEAQATIADQKTQVLKFKAKDANGEWRSALHSVTVHISHIQTYIVTYWNEFGRPALDAAVDKALEINGQVKISTQLSIETIKNELIPAFKKQALEFFAAYVEPNIELLTEKTVDFYHSSKSFVAQKVQELADPQIQLAKEFSKPYIAQVVMMIDEATLVTRTHLVNIRIALKPYTKQVLPAYRKFIKAATFYHHKVQKFLKEDRLTQSVATIELAWLLATLVLALPAVLMLKLTSIIFRKKENNKYTHRSSSRYHVAPTSRRLKRAYPGK